MDDAAPPDAAEGFPERPLQAVQASHLYLSLLIFYLFNRRETALDRMLAPLGMSVARWRTLLAIARLEGCSMSDLARYCYIDRTTLTRTIDRMVADRLVTRSVPATDRRQVVLNLTDKGWAAFHEAAAPIEAFGQQMVHGISPADQIQATATLEAMLCNMFGEEAEMRDLVTVGGSVGRRHRPVF